MGTCVESVQTFRQFRDFCISSGSFSRRWSDSTPAASAFHPRSAERFFFMSSSNPENGRSATQLRAVSLAKMTRIVSRRSRALVFSRPCTHLARCCCVQPPRESFSELFAAVQRFRGLRRFVRCSALRRRGPTPPVDKPSESFNGFVD